MIKGGKKKKKRSSAGKALIGNAWKNKLNRAVKKVNVAKNTMF